MTQTCDLENEKVTEVLVAKIVSWPDAVNAAVEAGNTYAKSERFRKG